MDEPFATFSTISPPVSDQPDAFPLAKLGLRLQGSEQRAWRLTLGGRSQ